MGMNWQGRSRTYDLRLTTCDLRLGEITDTIAIERLSRFSRCRLLVPHRRHLENPNFKIRFTIPLTNQNHHVPRHLPPRSHHRIRSKGAASFDRGPAYSRSNDGWAVIQEIPHIVDNVTVPVKPILLQGEEMELATLVDLRKNRRSLLETYVYENEISLINNLERMIIEPAEELFKQLN